MRQLAISDYQKVPSPYCKLQNLDTLCIAERWNGSNVGIDEPGQRRRFRVAISPETERQLFGETLCLVRVGSTTTFTTHHIMSDKPIPPPTEGAASATAENVAAKAAAVPKALPEQNAAFRMMGRCIATADSQAVKAQYGSVGTDDHML